jgi:L-alanine-DL-glutamate epimerase-like enolase superfamily enzyme
MHVELRRVDWEFKSVFRISYKTLSRAETVQVELTEGEHTGRGEACGVSYHDESADLLLKQLESVRDGLAKGISREQLPALLSPGGARCAVDCALWDLEAKRAGRRAWELAGFTSVQPLVTAFTLSLDTPKAMAEAAAAAKKYSLLKLKLGGEGDKERVAAVRQARPDVRIIVDANQAWNERQLQDFVPRLAELGVELIEQPMPAGKDDALLGFKSAVPLCADESCQTTESLPALKGKYQFINIKLDKTGGLTEALRLARAAQQEKFKLMVGCMAGSSLSMAPAYIIGQLCHVIDLDGPLLATSDMPHAIRYEGSQMFSPEKDLWG